MLSSPFVVKFLLFRGIFYLVCFSLVGALFLPDVLVLFYLMKHTVNRDTFTSSVLAAAFISAS